MKNIFDLAQTPQSLNFTIERVTSEFIMERDWEPLLVEIFPDENDREPLEDLIVRMHNGEDFFLMRDHAGKPVGIELSQTQNGNGAMYTPWTGVIAPLRNMGVGAQMNRSISDYMVTEHGVTHTLLDIEDPARLHTSAYPQDELEEAIGMASRRINFWRRESFLIVDDESKVSGEKLEYVRPASDDHANIQAYDMMSIRFEGNHKQNPNLSEDGKSIRTSFVRDCYLQMTRIQYGNFVQEEYGDASEETMRKVFPAVDKYLSDIDAIKSDFIPLMTSEIHPKSTPAILCSIRMLPDAEAASQELAREGKRSSQADLKRQPA